MKLFFFLVFIILTRCTCGQQAGTGKINSEDPSFTTGTNKNSANPQVTSTGYQINQGIQPYSYGYNTGIRPYSYSYTYPQNGGKPQVTFQNVANASPQQQQVPQQQAQQQLNGMVPIQPQAYYGVPYTTNGGFTGPANGQTSQAGVPFFYSQQQQTIPLNPFITGMNNKNLNFPGTFSNNAYPVPQQIQPSYGYAPIAQMQPIPVPITMNNQPPNIPSIPDINNANLPNLSADFDLPNLSNSNTNSNHDNNANNFADFGVDNLDQNGNSNNNLPANDLNSELASLTDPTNTGTQNTNTNNNNINNNQIPTSLNDFNIDGIGGATTNNNNNNNINNNGFNGLSQDLLSPLNTGGSNSNSDFTDLNNLANLANGGLLNVQNANQVPNNNNQDFNFGGSNNNLDFDFNLPSASNRIQSNLPLKKNKKNANLTKKSDLRHKHKTLEEKQKKKFTKRAISDQKQAENLQNKSNLEINPDSPRGMLNVNPRYQNPYQGVYSQYSAYRLM